MMSGAIQGAAPLIALAMAVGLLLAVIAIRRSHMLAAGTCGLGLVSALVSIPWAMRAVGTHGGPLFQFNDMALGAIGLILVASLIVLVLAYAYWENCQSLIREEYSVLLLIGALGASALAASASFITLFLGLETMTLATIGLIAYPRHRPEAEEAAIKYLVLSGMSSAFVLFGIGLVYLARGSLALEPVLAGLRGGGPDHRMVLAGIAMIGVGAGFKLSVVPFHIWVPDIYAGAPAPSGAFLAVVPKIAVLAVLIRLLALPAQPASGGVFNAIAVVAMLSMIVGNLLALMEQNLKRIFGYSSIAHIGYLLVALIAAGSVGQKAAVFYIFTYATTVIAAFGVVAVLSRSDRSRDIDRLEDLRGLFWTDPAVAAIMTLAVFSLAGIPPALGFIAKMYVMSAAVHTDLRVLTSTLVVSSLIGLVYYLNILIVMTLKPGVANSRGGSTPVSMPGGIAIALVAGSITVFGISPQPLIAILTSLLG